jgi:hypothetical protein
MSGTKRFSKLQAMLRERCEQSIFVRKHAETMLGVIRKAQWIGKNCGQEMAKPLYVMRDM